MASARKHRLAPPPRRVEEPDYRLRTLGLLVAFALLLAVGVVTVLVPSLASDDESEANTQVVEDGPGQ